MDEEVIVPPDYPVEVELINKATGKVIETSTATAATLNAHYTVLSYMFKPLGCYGGGWSHPETGEPYPQGLTTRAFIAHPVSGERVCVSR